MRSFLLTVFTALSLWSSAQRTCVTPSYNGQYKTTLPSVVNNATQQDTVADQIIYIPVVVHVLYNLPEHNISDAQVLSQIDALNRDFSLSNDNRHDIPEAFQHLAADTRIRFCLAKVDPQGRPTTGIVRKHTDVTFFQADESMKFSAAGGSDGWNPDYYLNIWVCNLFGQALGYSSTPGFQRELDGVVIKWNVFGTVGNLRAPYNEGRTATHEVGHWLGLRHIWGDGLCASDDIDDTPPQKSFNSGCPNFPKVSDCSINGDGDMFMNYMDLTNDACMSMFTHGQKAKMRGIFALGNARNAMLGSNVCDSNLVAGGPLPGPLPEPEPAPVVDVNVKVYPNPSNGIVYIESPTTTNTPVHLSVFDIHGRVVLKKNLVNEKETIYLNGLPSGVYLIKLQGDDVKKTFKLVKK